jgi:ketosteroid isomerase-like protein
MSENAETVRQFVAALNDLSLDPVIELCHPEITWRAIEGAPDDIGVFQGHQALREYYQQWVDTFDDIRTELIEEPIEAGERIVIVYRGTARMKDSETEVEMTVAVVAEVRDRKIISGREFATREEAIEAAGISE